MFPVVESGCSCIKYGSRQVTNMEASGRIQAKHGNSSIGKQLLGTKGNNIRLNMIRQQLYHVSTYLVDR